MSGEKIETRLPAGFDWRTFTPEDSPLTPPDIMADPKFVRLATPDLAEGDALFDFDLPVHDFSDGTRRATDTRFHLETAASARPVALVFGSYT